MLDDFLDALLASLPGPHYDYEEAAKRLPVFPRALVHILTFATVLGLMWFVGHFIQPYFAQPRIAAIVLFIILIIAVIIAYGIIGRLWTRLASAIWLRKQGD